MTINMSTSDRTRVDNGVNVEALLGAREALDQAPDAAQFKWRATCEWLTEPTAVLSLGVSLVWVLSSLATRPSVWKPTIRKSLLLRIMPQPRWSLSYRGSRVVSRLV